MPPSPAVTRRNKIKEVTSAISKSGFRSVNDFLVAFYTSEDEAIVHQAHNNLRYTSGAAFRPERILEAWLEHGPAGTARKQLHRVITNKAADILIAESTSAYQHSDLRVSASGVDIPHLSANFSLDSIWQLYQTLLPCLCLLLSMLLSAPNRYEVEHGVEKQGKGDMVIRLSTVIISILLFGRNRATDAFQLVMGLFLSSAGASRRVIDTLNHMGLSVSYQTVQRALVTLTERARQRARDFIKLGERLTFVVYDNINFTLRKYSQRVDSSTEQINATTLALIAFPTRFTTAAYAAALSIAEKAKLSGLRRLLHLSDLQIPPEKQVQMCASFEHHVREILLEHLPGLSDRAKVVRRFRKKTLKRKPRVRILESERTEFPLPALNEEEASVQGTIRVVEKIMTKILGLAVEAVDTQLRLFVGDWLTICNLRLIREERRDDLTGFDRMDWIQEASMPFHFQLNAIYMIFRTHLGQLTVHDPASLHHHRSILRRLKLDPKKPEYNKAKELVLHSLIARIIDCARTIISRRENGKVTLRKWQPSWEDFDAVVKSIVENYATTAAGHDALERGDEVFAHSIFFNRDALMFLEFCDAIRDADVGRMWCVYDHWIFMMRGAGCHNYGNELLKMKAQYEHELPLLLREVVERTWLVNQWGEEGRNIPTDLYLEHNNGFTKNMFAAMGSGASIDHVQNKSSACVEILRHLAHQVSTWFGVRDFHRGHKHVDFAADLIALCNDLEVHGVHTFHSDRRVSPPPSKRKSNRRSTGVRDILTEGMITLSEKNMFEQWRQRTGGGGTDLYGAAGDDADDEFNTGTAFDNPNGGLEVDVNADEEFGDDAVAEIGSTLDDM